MVSYNIRLAFGANVQLVLILIVVDNGLVRSNFLVDALKSMSVLILIVVDNGLVQIKAIFNTNAIDVLILIVVDNGLVLKATAKQLEDQLKS